MNIFQTYTYILLLYIKKVRRQITLKNEYHKEKKNVTIKKQVDNRNYCKSHYSVCNLPIIHVRQFDFRHLKNLIKS